MKITFDPVKLVGYTLTFIFLILGETHAAVWSLFIASAFSLAITWGK
jgi:hypothetical protein